MAAGLSLPLPSPLPSPLRLRELTPAQAEQAAALLDEALDLAPEQRPGWLAALAERDPPLANAVAGLLQAATPTATTTPRLETAELISRRIARSTAPSLEGRRFGPYRIKQLLGQGGMGSVWLAERADGLFERDVALKLVHPSLFGPTLHARFARERRILAALAHPNIARLLDAGIAPDGQPYLALELVRGTPLNEHCDQHRLPLRERLALMLQVLAAVQHAHQNLVIHRDLKPANILVTDSGQVRLLDFGIAKLMQDGSAAETELTQHGGRALTPQYASPEQAAGRPVGTASDVYSLAVVLYELLCGQRPAAVTVSLAEPTRPSQQVLNDEVARQRRSTPRALAHALAGDLDTIALKALKTDPAERYPTADAFLQDLQRHLAGQPVLARPDSTAYRLRKFVQRHRLRVALAGAAGALLLAATGVSLWQADRAHRMAAQAQSESQRAQVVQAFLVDVFNANSLRQADPQKARQATAGDLLDAGAARVGAQLKDSPQAQAAVLDVLADMYFQLERFDDAARLREQRVTALEQVHGRNDARVAEALLSVAHDVSAGNRRERGIVALDQARRILDAIGDRSSEMRGWVAIESARIEQYLAIGPMRQHADDALRQFRAEPGRWTNLFHALQMAARARYLAGDQAAAQALHQEALLAVEHNEPSTAAWRITPWVHLAESHHEAVQWADAEGYLRRALAEARQLHGDAAGATLQTQAKLGGFLHATGRRSEGWQLLQSAQATLARPETRATPDAAATLRRFVGTAALARGEFELGRVQLADEVADLRANYPRSVPLARTLQLQAAVLTAQGRFADSRAALDEAEQLWQAAGGNAVAAQTMHRYWLEQARLALAQSDAALALQRLQAVSLPNPFDAVQVLVLQAEAALLQQRPADAEALASQALQQLDAAPLQGRLPDLQADALLQRGRARQQRGELANAGDDLRRALVLRQAEDAGNSPWTTQVQTALAETLLAAGERRGALALARQAQAALAAQPAVGAQFRAPLQALLSRLSSAAAAPR